MKFFLKRKKLETNWRELNNIQIVLAQVKYSSSKL